MMSVIATLSTGVMTIDGQTTNQLSSGSVVLSSDAASITANAVKQAIARLTTTRPMADPAAVDREHEAVQVPIFTPPKFTPPKWNWSIHCVQQTSSTNVELWQRLANQPEPESAVALIAHEQTRGKGQWNRAWRSPPGGLYLSAALPLHFTTHEMPVMMLSTACGITSLFRAVGFPIQLKWPNDLVVSGKKLGGILIESRLRGDRFSRCVVGVGINWMNPMPDNGVSLQSLLTPESARHCRQLSDVGALVLLGIEAGIDHWKRHGSQSIAHLYNQYLANTHQWVRLPETIGDRYPDCVGLKGRIVGVAPNGDLIVQVVRPHQALPISITFAPGTIAIGYGQQ
ncbi:MAG: biotin--[acetyl-CoA-carboxylase] ligase [Cyanobacteria bacterium J06633_2]